MALMNDPALLAQFAKEMFTDFKPNAHALHDALGIRTEHERMLKSGDGLAIFDPEAAERRAEEDAKKALPNYARF